MKVAIAMMVGMLTAPIGASEPRSVDLSSRSVTELAGCITLKLASSHGYEVQKIERASGMTLKLKFRIAGIAATAATFEIDNLGKQRRLTTFATGKSNGAPRTIAEQARACVSEGSPAKL